VDSFDNQARLQCNNRDSFGTSQAVELSLPPGVSTSSPMNVSASTHRGQLYLIILDLDQQQCLIMPFNLPGVHTLQNIDHEGSGRSRFKTKNSLVRCHTDVWTRFPIHSPISHELHGGTVKQQPSIFFVSNLSHPPFSEYFRSMVVELGSTAHKSITTLQSIQIESSTDLLIPEKISTWPMGHWLARLYCLVPINIAVTASNQFLPLKDGLTSGELEEQLLGANLLQTIQSSVILYSYLEPHD
jgi:hypothetical protein